MNTLELRGHQVTIPAEWKELTARHVLLLGALFPLLPTHEKGLAILLGFIRLSGGWRIQWTLYQNMVLGRRLQRKLGYNPFVERLELAMEALDQFEWIYKDNMLSENRFPVVRSRGRSYYGPSEQLKNLEINEFSYADGFYTQYLKNPGEIKFLELLIATLWRGPGPGHPNDPRRYFYEQSLDEDIAWARRLPDARKKALLINYIGMRNAVVRSKPGKAVFTRSLKTEARKTGWGHVILRMAGGKFGEYDKTRRAMLWDVLRELEMQKQDAIELRRRQKK